MKPSAVLLLFSIRVFAGGWDAAVFSSINDVRHPVLDITAQAVHYSSPIYPLTWGYLTWNGFARDSAALKRSSLFCAGGVISLFLVNQLVKASFQRTRPFYAVEGAQGEGPGNGFITDIVPSEKYSFPSQATSLSFFCAKYFGDAMGWKPLWYALAGLSGWQRIYSASHYPGDVVGGAALGYGTAWLTEFLRDRNSRSRSSLVILPAPGGVQVSGRF